MHLHLVALVVEEYDPAIAFFVDILGFELVEDSAALTNDGRPKRWVVVRPPGAETGMLLARADGDVQRAVVGQQVAGPGRVLPPRR
jgi:catechol 2,3-dioxygenase-like lactoylglutathione lyase family enzyme